METTTIQPTYRKTPVKQRVETNLLPPDMAVRIAWALTNQLSESESVRVEANRAIRLMEDIKRKANESNDDNEKLYVDWVCAAIDATFRNLVTIINGRNLNFDDVKKLRDKEIENINYYSQFTTNLQSSIPRISAMTIGGVAIPAIFIKFFSVPNEYFLALLAVGAAISYIVNGVIFIPILQNRVQIQKIKLDYDRTRYYDLYVERSKEALIALYISANNHHNSVFKNFYDSEKVIYSDVKKFIDEMLDSINSTMCKKISKCWIGKIITPNMWPVCETGIGLENCPHNKN